ncbi:hypothetical protein V6U90_04115 [Micromonospora sp. CPCC 206060]|uniref:hypothetical protein n=1 Tax=Micromonospora sp. CPCC 206060 TaxID=3122406 RepID=UPI002FEFD34F
MDSLHRIAARLDDAATTLSAVAYAVTATDPPQAAFGTEAAGRPGELGRALHAQWRAATGNRAREAAGAAARIAAAAEAVRAAANGYTDTDHGVRRRQRGEG